MHRDTSPLDPHRRSLHAILRRHLATFLRAHPLPDFVRDELTGYLDCGVIAHGCARYRCDDCGHERVTAVSCKGRGFCPRCIGPRATVQDRSTGIPGRWADALPPVPSIDRWDEAGRDELATALQWWAARVRP